MFHLRPFSRRNDDFYDKFTQLVDEMFNQDFLPSLNGKFNSLRTDITETKDAYLVEADLPGFSKENIQIELENNQLTIRAKRDEKTEMKDENDKIIRQERHFGEFVRSFYIDNVDQDQVEAKLEDGVLKIKLPKVNPDDRGPVKRIDIL